MIIRLAETGDAAALAAIYAPIVRDTIISFETEAPGPDEMAGRLERITRTHPWLVAEQDGRVLGFAYASPHRDRAAYRWSVDVTAYVAEDVRGRGVGRALYEALLRLLRTQGFKSAFAGVTQPNPASVALHEGVGFQAVGLYRGVGYKHGAWRDVGWWGLALHDDDGPPSEPTPFPELDPQLIRRALA